MLASHRYYISMLVYHKIMDAKKSPCAMSLSGTSTPCQCTKCDCQHSALKKEKQKDLLDGGLNRGYDPRASYYNAIIIYESHVQL